MEVESTQPDEQEYDAYDNFAATPRGVALSHTERRSHTLTDRSHGTMVSGQGHASRNDAPIDCQGSNVGCRQTSDEPTRRRGAGSYEARRSTDLVGLQRRAGRSNPRTTTKASGTYWAKPAAGSDQARGR